ncbi:MULTISPECIES: methyl-accepting chemotaxis protein [unclassified Pseudomonas]|uniref:methyl-accepting chemotaxis protein n=1 Tax=unclassified Pseudomonas TaxID=196821 RepID=UPI000DAF464F|nr:MULTISPECIES: methyl-accepting chemotaxis protein [unclassified Pseudomonas]MBD9655535.1 methyl-accepting chemotaxis protein [Pseudomonas sp. PDM12]PZW47559.1 methyl-accepting chemotaxis protein [Pseudomonas sp. URMO17WK12:I2]
MLLRRINVAPRAALFFSLIVLIVVLLGAVAIIQMKTLREVEQDVETNWMASVRQAGLMNAGVLRLRLESLRGNTSNDPQILQQTLDGFTGYRTTFFDAVKNYEKLVASEEERKLYGDVRASAQAYARLLDQFEPLMRNGDSAGAVALINTTIRPVTNAMQDQIAALRDYNDRGAEAAGIRASQAYSTGLMLVGALIAIAIVATILLAYLLTRSITVPISEAVQIAQRIAKKDLTEKIVVIGKDEAAAMLSALDQMQGNLRQTIGHIADSSNQLASASEEMTSVTEESSRGLVRQNDEVNQAATAVTEMSAAVDEVARNAAEAADASQRTHALTSAGIDNVARTLKAIQDLTQNVGNTSGQVQQLSSRAQEISKVVEVIRAIAEQTNLLALNAAIEAARAGEQGRGFAVVADEVRALAHRTQQSTQEIEQMIGGIQSDSVQAVRAMEQSQQMASDSTAVAQNANSSLQQISEAITLINERNILIATAAEEQAQVAREIDRNITSIRDLSTQSADGASQTAMASGEVSKLAVGLNRVVGEFVI